MNETNINQDEVMLQLLSSNFGEEFITQSQADNKLFTYKKCEYYTGTQMLLQSAQEYNQLLSLNINCQQSLEIFKVGQKNSSTFILYKNLVIPSLSISIDGVIPPNVQLSFELKCFGRRRSRECSQTSYGNSTQGNRCQYQEVEFENESNIITIMNQNGAASFKSVRFSQTSEETTNISNQYKFFVLVKFQKKDDYENKSHLLSLYRSPAFTIVSRKKSLQKRNAAINLIQPFVPLEFLKRLEYKKNSEDTQKEITDQGIDGFMEFISNSNIRHKASQVLYKIQQELTKKFIHHRNANLPKNTISKQRSPIIISINIKQPHSYQSIQKNSKFFLKIRKLMEPITAGHIDIMFQDSKTTSSPDNYIQLNNDQIMSAYTSIYPKLLNIVHDIKKDEFPTLDIPCIEDNNIKTFSDINSKNIKVAFLLQKGGRYNKMERDSKKTYIRALQPQIISKPQLLQNQTLQDGSQGNILQSCFSKQISHKGQSKKRSSKNYYFNVSGNEKQLSSLNDYQIQALHLKNSEQETQHSQCQSINRESSIRNRNFSDLINQQQSFSQSADNSNENEFEKNINEKPRKQLQVEKSQIHFIDKQLFECKTCHDEESDRMSQLNSDFEIIQQKCNEIFTILTNVKEKIANNDYEKHTQFSNLGNTLQEFMSQCENFKQISSNTEDNFI